MSILTADQLLDRMLKFANSPECPPERKIEVENGAWKCWAYSITEHNPFAYEKVKHEKIHYIEGFPIVNKLKTYGVYKKKKMTAADWIQRRKDAQYKIQLAKEAKKQSEKKEAKIRTNESKKKPVIDLDTKKVYSSCTEAAKANNIQVGTLSNYLLKKRRVRPKIVNFAYLSDYKKPEFKQIEKAKPKPFSTRIDNYSSVNKQIIDLDTLKVYDSITIFCNEMDLQKSSISKYLRTNNRNWLVKRVRQTLNIMYYTDFQLLNKSNESAKNKRARNK